MSTKIIFKTGLALLFATFLSGCATAVIMNEFNESRVDVGVNPAALYQATNAAKFALGGPLESRYQNGNRAKSDSTNFTYLMIPQKASDACHLDKNQPAPKIDKISREDAKQLVPKKSLPADYEKVADLKMNGVFIATGNYHTAQGAVIIFAPITVAFDVATAPIQIPFIILIFSAMGHGC